MLGCRDRIVLPLDRGKTRDDAFEASHTKATRIFQHIYLMYANDLSVLNEGIINHHNDGLF